MKRTLKWKLAQYFEIRWWKKYQKDKDISYIKSKRNYWNNVLQDISSYTRINKNDVVLDAGCGPSGMYMVLDCNIDAVDPLLDHYETNIHFFSKSDYSNVNFFCVPFEGFKTTKEYDHIFCMNAINHFSELEFSLDKLHDLLKSNGTLTLGVDVHRSSFLEKIFSFLSFDVLHPHQFTKKGYMSLFQNAQFQVEFSKTIKKGFIFNYELFVLLKHHS